MHPAPRLLVVLAAVLALAAPAATHAANGPVRGSGADLCPWGAELPAGSDAIVGEDNTRNARNAAFKDAPKRLHAADRLKASWTAAAGGALGPVSPECTVYVFDKEPPIDDLWAWFADGYAAGSEPSPTEEPLPAGAVAPGEEGRLFHFPPIGDRDVWTYIFHQANVIASVSLDTEAGAGTTAEDVLALAGATAARITAAAAGSPEPPSPTATPEPKFPSPAESDLIAHVPESFRQACERTEFGVSAAAQAAVACQTSVGDGSATVTYQQFADEAGMSDAYERFLTVQSIAHDSGSCSEGSPAEGSYTVADVPAGRVACTTLGGGLAPLLAWTDTQKLILGFAEGFDIDGPALFGWWLSDSGPV